MSVINQCLEFEHTGDACVDQHHAYMPPVVLSVQMVIVTGIIILRPICSRASRRTYIIMFPVTPSSWASNTSNKGQWG